MSIGARWELSAASNPLITTILFNPIMGHVKLTCTSSVISDRTRCALQYKVNLHSFDADLAIGLEHAPLTNQLVRLRLSLLKGLAISVQSSIEEGVRLGLGIASGPLVSSDGVATQLPISKPRPAIGLELSVEA